MGARGRGLAITRRFGSPREEARRFLDDLDRQPTNSRVLVFTRSFYYGIEPTKRVFKEGIGVLFGANLK